MLGQIEFNGIRSYDDFNFVISDIKIGEPTPNTIFASVPFQNGVYDFSAIGGEITYSTRTIQVTFLLNKYEVFQERINSIYSIFKNKLYSDTFKPLKVSWLDGTFSARVSSISDINLLEEDRTIEVIFIAQPFRTFEEYEGTDIWDNFNFETDYVQYNSYDVEDKKEIVLYNLSSIRANPYIICNASGMSLIYKNKEYVLQGGSNKPIRLEKGKNTIIVKGTGNITFLWKREVI